MRRGWMGAGYLVARRLDPDGEHAHLVARFGQGLTPRLLRDDPSRVQMPMTSSKIDVGW
jgi:hypothetical protein